MLDMILCMIGATEIILICAVILLIFGGKKLPELMKGVGKGVKSFKEGMAEPTEEEIQESPTSILSPVSSSYSSVIAGIKIRKKETH